MTTKWTIRISPQGTVTTLYDDALALDTLGELAIERASDVEYSNTAQLWHVSALCDSGNDCFFKTRGEAIVAERAYFFAKLGA